jgi:hypothetical protein
MATIELTPRPHPLRSLLAVVVILVAVVAATKGWVG